VVSPPDKAKNLECPVHFKIFNAVWRKKRRLLGVWTHFKQDISSIAKKQSHKPD